MILKGSHAGPTVVRLCFASFIVLSLSNGAFLRAQLGDVPFPLMLKLTTLVGSAVDYFFIYGPEFDAMIQRYRSMTGHVPMLPKWSYGLFQSKDRYKSQSEILDMAAHYCRDHIPLDAIVQDWFWWKTEGDPIFNENSPMFRRS